MADNEARRFLVIGLPDMGKTTFLAALWHVVESKEIASALQLVNVEGNREYIGKLREKWIACEALGRTAQGQVSVIQMRLRAAADGTEANLALPDVSGETFRTQLRDRAWTPEYAQLAAGVAGALVFIHPDEVTEPVRIEEAAPLAAAIAPEGTVEGAGAAKAWTHDDIPTQVNIVELLQFHRARTPGPFSVGIVVSAWDLVAAQGKTPTEWLDATLPLLGQFLRSNVDELPFKVFGVSAQGGELNAVDQLMAAAKPSERIQVADDREISHDITRPISWLLKTQAN